ncbi:hypothetical protein R80B4_01270 [Fibrobacteres bacterium R8-0-B4]
MRKSNRGGVTAEVVAVVGMGLIVVIAAGLLVSAGVKWLRDYRPEPKHITIEFNDSDGGASDSAGSGNEEGQVAEEPPIQADTGHFTDNRDGKTYRSARIGGILWMAENLNYKTSMGSWCDADVASNCDKYGRLYDWFAARTACPSGWHLPASEEWDILGTAAGGEMMIDGKGVSRWSGAGGRLKAKRGWNEELRGVLEVRTRGSETYVTEGPPGKAGNGTDDYGFSALPGNGRFPNGSFFFDFKGNWWTATEGGGEFANRVYIHNDSSDLFEGEYLKLYGFYVRCAADK